MCNNAVYNSSTRTCENERKDVLTEIHHNIINFLQISFNEGSEKYDLVNIIRKGNSPCLLGGNYRLRKEYLVNNKILLQLESLSGSLVYKKEVDVHFVSYISMNSFSQFPIFFSEDEVFNILKQR